MFEKKTLESNTFACKTFACGTLANNQQTIAFVTITSQNSPTSYVSSSWDVYPTDMKNTYAAFWHKPAIGNVLLSGQLMSSGYNELLTERLMSEPGDEVLILNSLVTLGRATGTDVVFGMGISYNTTNKTQPKAFNAQLMKEPT